MDKHPELCTARRIILQNARDKNPPLFFRVDGYQIVDKETLAEKGYPIRKKTAATQHYLLYHLSPCGDPIPDTRDIHPLAIVGGKPC